MLENMRYTRRIGRIGLETDTKDIVLVIPSHM